MEAWREKWLSQVFPSMVPRPKWKNAVRNLRTGDIGHVRYDKKLGPDAWKIAKIVCTKEDEEGLVRTIVVSFRPRHTRDRDKPYSSKRPVTMKIGVQRFSVLLPAEEQGSESTPTTHRPLLTTLRDDCSESEDALPSPCLSAMMVN